jgi:hypothetical protein
MLDSFLRQVAKDAYGPLSFPEKSNVPVVIHKFSDSFSVLGWGKMPEPIADRGRLGSLVFTCLNQRLVSGDHWKSFLKSHQALSFRKAGASISQGGSVSAMLNGISERLPLRTNYHGALDESVFRSLDGKAPLRVQDLLNGEAIEQAWVSGRVLYPVCGFYPEEKIPSSTLMGRATWDLSQWRSIPAPKMLPYEVLCHFTLNERSVESLRTDSISIPKTASLHTLQVGASWDFPVMELVLPQDPFARRVGLSECLWITGMSADRIQEILLEAAWTAAWLRFEWSAMGLNLESVQLRFAVEEDGARVLVDPFQVDDMGLEKNGVRFRFETALSHYQKTSWYDAVLRSQAQAAHLGMPEWRRQCVEPVPFLDPKVKTRIEEEQKLLSSAILGKLQNVL